MNWQKKAKELLEFDEDKHIIVFMYNEKYQIGEDDLNPQYIIEEDKYNMYRYFLAPKWAKTLFECWGKEKVVCNKDSYRFIAKVNWSSFKFTKYYFRYQVTTLLS